MTTDLTRARRKLAQLKRRLALIKGGANALSFDVFRQIEGEDKHDKALIREARRMAREYEKQIKEQELECRRLALTTLSVNVGYRSDGSGPLWYVTGINGGPITWFRCGQAGKARAVAWAERQNAKQKGGAE